MGKQTLRDAKYSVHQLTQKATSLSFNTRYDYKQILCHSLETLYNDGIQLPSINNLKRKHIMRLLEQWQQQDLSNATIKNRLSAVRFALRQLGKSQMLPADNKALAIGQRHKQKINRAITKLPDNISNPYVAYSLRLQQAFGLRRQEAIKFKVSVADKGHYLAIQASWTKGGIPRVIPVVTDPQRQLLDELHQFCGKQKALIPDHKTYRQQLDCYVSVTRQVGIKNGHGLRHAYAQQRYRTLTDKLTQGHGWDASINGGIPRKQLNPIQKKIDHQVREVIANELGHSRVTVLANYCDI